MMRWKLALVAVLALPLAASAGGLLRHGDCASGDCSGGKGGLFGGHKSWGYGNGGYGLHGGHGGHGGHGTGGTGASLGLFQRPFQAAPWYLYWPYDQHFQMPAPINAPYLAPQAYASPGLNPYVGPAAIGAPPQGQPK